MNTQMNLNGTWLFSFDGGPETEIQVPGCFDAAGPLQFRRGIAVYRRKVTCDGPVELSGDGIGLRAEFFWDDALVGTEAIAYTPFRFRFNAGSPDEHELRIVCDNTHQETPESCFRIFYDFYGFGGIYRPLQLRRLPETYFDTVRILPDPSSGNIRLLIELGGPQCPVDATIDGTPVGTHPGSGETTFQVPSPRLWSPEHPNLHTLHLTCGTDSYECRFGLRSIEARDGRFFLNGEPLKLIGVNRHDCFPELGPASTPECVRKDLQMLKEAGFNTIRGAHYPQSQTLLDLADEMGLLIWDETLGWENPIESLTNPLFQERQRDALTRMIRASVNHPSIIVWGFLNEAATNQPEARAIVGDLVRLAHSLDPSRPVTFASMHRETDCCLDLVDILSFNIYPGWYSGKNVFFEPTIVEQAYDRLLKELALRKDLEGKPVLISEIGAGALRGDFSGRRWSENYQAQLLETAVSLARSNPEIAGILLWQFCDTPVDNERIMMRPRGYNNKGLVDEFRRPKLAWKTISDLLHT